MPQSSGADSRSIGRVDRRRRSAASAASISRVDQPRRSAARHSRSRSRRPESPPESRLLAAPQAGGPGIAGGGGVIPPISIAPRSRDVRRSRPVVSTSSSGRPTPSSQTPTSTPSGRSHRSCSRCRGRHRPGGCSSPWSRPCVADYREPRKSGCRAFDEHAADLGLGFAGPA